MPAQRGDGAFEQIARKGSARVEQRGERGFPADACEQGVILGDEAARAPAVKLPRFARHVDVPDAGGLIAKNAEGRQEKNLPVPPRRERGPAAAEQFVKQGLIAVALVIFARWSPLRCLVAALLFGGAGAIGPALQSVGVGWGYHLFNTVPYVLTLLILVVTCKPGSVAAGSPGELSSTK